jgi:putative peptidoglycan lipid II flippase
MTREGADLVARVLSAFAIGLPTFSAFLVLTRAFYALSDTKTPALVNAAVTLVASAIGAVLFFSVERRWAVPGLALGHSIGFAVGAIALGRLLSRRIGIIFDRDSLVVMARTVVVAAVSGAAMAGVAGIVPGEGRASALLSVVAAGAAGVVVYVGAMAALGSAELSRLLALVRRSGESAG